MAYLVRVLEVAASLKPQRYLLVVPINDDVVGAANRDVLRKETDQVRRWVEGLWGTRRKVEKLVEVKDLDVVANSLGADDHVVVQDTDLSPSGSDTLSWETTDVLHLSVAENFNESSTGKLTNDAELSTTSLVPPSP